MPSTDLAFNFLTEHGREMFGIAGSMLYVGHRSDTHPWWRTTFRDVIGGPRLDVIDIVKANLDSANEFASGMFHGDIRSFDASGYGLFFWDEGPEHLPREEALELLHRVSQCNDHVLISCPWGYMPQGNGPGDPEFHHWGPQIADFESIGFQARVFGTEFDGHGNGHGNLIAWI